MATVDLDQVNKVYENGFHAVKDLSLDVREGEFAVKADGMQFFDPGTERAIWT